jgi:hypothetical protein
MGTIMMHTLKIALVTLVSTVAVMAFAVGCGVPLDTQDNRTDTQIAWDMDNHGDRDGTPGEFQELEDGSLIGEDEPGWACSEMGNLECGI